MKKSLILVAVVALLAMLIPGCAPEQGASSPTGEEANFRLLISDEVNAISHFASVNVTISSIGLQQRGKPGGWITHELDPKKTENLKDLVGENATEIWSGYVDPGEYTKVFIHVDNVTGILDSAYGGGTANVTLPSDKLQISKPFTLNPDLLVNFVFDITVVEAGKSGKYILKPQIDPSGPNKPFNEVTVRGKPENTGKPEDEGKPEGQEAEEMEFEGIIVSIGGDNWTVEIEGVVRTVNVEAAKIEGTPDEGLEVKIEGTEGEDNTIIASEVEVKEAEEEEFKGTIVSISDNWTMEIKGEMWVVDVSEADIAGDPVEKLEAEIKGTVVADKTIKASEVEIKELGE